MDRKKWWKEAVVYQIYPRSFCDSNGDGIGDIPGIVSKLDYLKELGVDVVWLSPVYASPNDDNGYDISDYQAIAPEYGTMADMDAFIDGLHRRGMKLLMDLVVNHTSDEHTWFRASRRSRDNPYRDWYIWRPPREGREPNNWQSAFGGSAWQYDAATGEYYLHLFSPKQPDLNWENPAVRDAVFRMMDWWLAKGVDGFRMDVINMISKAPGLPDAPARGDGPYQWGGEHFIHGPRLIELLQEMKDRVLSRYDVATVGETPMVTASQAVELTHEETGPLDMVFNFEHVMLDQDPSSLTGKWHRIPVDLRALKGVMTRWQQALDGRGWNSLYLSNHDQPRSVSRFGNDGRHREAAAKLLATYLHTLQGTPYIYQGEEIGMTNVAFPRIDDYRDIETVNFYREWVDERGGDPDEALAAIHAKSRDNARTPMQWDDRANAGFTTGTPWLAVNPNYTAINVQAARNEPGSVFHYYRGLIELRRRHPVFAYGRYEPLAEDDTRICAYTRRLHDEQLLVVLNFSDEPSTFATPADYDPTRAERLIGNHPPATDDGPTLRLQPWEARVYRWGAARG